MKSKKLVVVLASFVFALLQVQSASAFSGGGTGTPSDPYEIDTCQELQDINDDLAASYELIGYVHCSGFDSGSGGFEPIGDYDSSAAFTGTLDGNGFSISGITVNQPTTDYVGLFSMADGAVISDLTIREPDITGEDYVGGLIGYGDNLTLTNLTLVDAVMTGKRSIASLGAWISASQIDYVQALDVTVAGNEAVGTVNEVAGLIASLTSSDMTRASATGTITGNIDTGTSNKVAGLIAYVSDSFIDDSYADVSVVGDSAVSGLIGQSTSSTISRVYAKGSVEASLYAGGLIARMYGGSLMNSFTVATVQASSHFGAVVGEMNDSLGNSTVVFVFYDDSSGSGPCAGITDGEESCSTMYLTSTPDFYKGNATNPPLNTWDFTTNIWRAVPGEYPSFMSVPDRPDNARVTPSSTSLIVSWDTPPDDGGSQITAYQLEYITPSGKQTVPMLSASQRSYTITGLTPVTEYMVQVRAINALGNSEWLGFITYTIATTATPAPTPGIASPAVSRSSAGSETSDTELTGSDDQSTIASVGSPTPTPTPIPSPASLVLSDTSSETTLAEVVGYTAIGIAGVGLLWLLVRLFGASPKPV